MLGMRTASWFFVTCLLLTIAQRVVANESIPQFDSRQQQARYLHLIAELRCPVCQNQSIADSEAALAQDLRQKTYELIIEGRSDDDIKRYMQQRYGDFVLYQPVLTSLTWPLWVAPVLLLLFIVGWFVRRHQHAEQADEERI